MLDNVTVNGGGLERNACGIVMPQGARCNMDAGHRGRHSSIAWRCDGCGKTQRGTPMASGPDGGDEDAGWLRFCFMCAPPQGTKRYDELFSEQDQAEWDRRREAVT